MKVNDLNQPVITQPIDALLGEVGFIERKGKAGVLLVDSNHLLSFNCLQITNH